MTKPTTSSAALTKALSTDCRQSGRNSGDNSSTSSSPSSAPIVVDVSRPTTPVVVDVADNSTSNSSHTTSTTTDTDLDHTRLLRKRSATTLSVSSDSSALVTAMDAIVPEVIDVDDLDDESTVKAVQGLNELIRAASILNPKQFELPRELNMFVQFPGSDRSETLTLASNNALFLIDHYLCSTVEPCAKLCAKKASRANSKKKPHELDSNGLVPLPAKTCFYCRRSCKRASLVACDYCPSYFHADCLDPPMTALPTGLWMCPNHPEQFIDWKLVQTISATERIKLWNRFNGPIDQDTVKAEFFRKVHATNPPFRFKRRTAARERVHIPPMVVYHYKHRTSLLPTLRDVLRCETVFQRCGMPLQNERVLERLLEVEQKPLDAMTREEDDKNEDTDDATEGTMAMDNDDDVIDNDVHLHESVQKNVVCVQMNPTDNSIQVGTPTPMKTINTTKAISETASSNRTANSNSIEMFELGHLDTVTIKRLALQRLQQICHDNPSNVDTYQRQSTAVAIQESLQRSSKRVAGKSLPSQLLTRADIERIAREFTSPSSRRTAPEIIDDALLHGDNGDKCCSNHQRIADGAVQLNGFDQLRTDADKSRELAARLVVPLRESRVRARAMLLPVDDILAGRRWFTKASMDGAVYMRYRQLTVGAGPGNDVPLRADVCSRVSGKHAVIFYDDVSV